MMRADWLAINFTSFSRGSSLTIGARCQRGAGVYEIRLHTAVEHRLFYIAKFAEGVYVLHAFEKRTRQTTRADIDLARHRLSELQHLRRGVQPRRRK
jgi:phage-related protein